MKAKSPEPPDASGSSASETIGPALLLKIVASVFSHDRVNRVQHRGTSMPAVRVQWTAIFQLRFLRLGCCLFKAGLGMLPQARVWVEQQAVGTARLHVLERRCLSWIPFLPVTQRWAWKETKLPSTPSSPSKVSLGFARIA